MTAYSDNAAREAIAYIRRNMTLTSSFLPFNDAVMRLVGYVTERLPRETKKARWINWHVASGDLGTRNRNEAVYDDAMPDFIEKLLNEDARCITIGDAFDKDIR